MPDKPHQEHEKVHTFLRQHPMGVLSTVAADGSPWGAAIYYIADEDFNFYFVTRAETSKYHNLDKTPLAALTIADSDSQTTVQVGGTVHALPPDRYMEVVFNKLAKIRPKEDHNWAPPLEKIHAGNYMPLYLVPNKLQYADYGHDKAEIHADYIERII
jgi:general stress protein 26